MEVTYRVHEVATIDGDVQYTYEVEVYEETPIE